MALAPENTLASIKLAVLSGLSFVEVDVKISKDQKHSKQTFVWNKLNKLYSLIFFLI